MSTTAKASDHVKPCNIEQSERHNRRDADYIASLNPRTLYVRTELSHNNESYVVPDLKGVTLQQHYDAIKAMVKQKTGRAMQEKKVTVIGKNGKPKERNGSSPIRESVVNIKPDTTMADLKKYTEKVCQRWGVRAIQIHIHKDEGHYTNPDDPSTWQPNLHAHIIWDWMNHETGKSFKLGKKDMEELQDMAAETLEMERGKRKSETGAEHLERNDYIIQKQENKIEELQKSIAQEKAKIEKMAKSSMFDKMFNSNLSPSVRKAFEEKDEAHKEELRQAIIAVDENGKTYEWVSGEKKGQLLTWQELLKFREKRHKEEMTKIIAEKDAAIVEKQAAIAKAKADKETAVAKAKADAKAELDAEIAEKNKLYSNIKSLNEKLSKSEESNKILLGILKGVRDFMFETCGQKFSEVVQMILDQWKAGIKHFAKEMKDIFLQAMSDEKTTEGRKSYVNDAFWYAKLLVKTVIDWKGDNATINSLQDDANRIADGTWESFHQQRNLLFEAAVNALVEMGNCPSQRHLNQKQANAIEAFIKQDGGDRDLLCSEIWDKVSPKVNYYWRSGTFDALEELRTRELYDRKVDTSISYSSRHM